MWWRRCRAPAGRAPGSNGWPSCARRCPARSGRDQYTNPDNPAGYRALADELAEDVGPFDVLVGSVGSGGSLCGTSRALRERHPDLHVVGVDSAGSVLFDQPDRPGRLQSGLGNSLHPQEPRPPPDRRGALAQRPGGVPVHSRPRPGAGPVRRQHLGLGVPGAQAHRTGGAAGHAHRRHLPRPRRPLRGHRLRRRLLGRARPRSARPGRPARGHRTGGDRGRLDPVDEAVRPAAAGTAAAHRVQHHRHRHAGAEGRGRARVRAGAADRPTRAVLGTRGHRVHRGAVRHQLPAGTAPGDPGPVPA